ncbi:DUF6537 domain-containing protein [Yinghuangia aomiensis]
MRAGEADGERIGVAYAKGLHKLMAYKDEYEVARLHLDTVEKARRDAEFGADADVSVLLHPPVLRALGVKRKIRLRRTAVPAFRALHAARGLRGTRFDVFGMAEVRRVERELVHEYRSLVGSALAHLTPETADVVASDRRAAGRRARLRGHQVGARRGVPHAGPGGAGRAGTRGPAGVRAGRIRRRTLIHRRSSVSVSVSVSVSETRRLPWPSTACCPPRKRRTCST